MRKWKEGEGEGKVNRSRTMQCWNLTRMVGHKLEIWLPVYKPIEIFLFLLHSAGNQKKEKNSRSCDNFIFQAAFILQSFCISAERKLCMQKWKKK